MIGNRHRACLASIALGLLLPVVGSAADSLFVQANETGQAITHIRNGRCYAALPIHVTCDACEMTGILPGGRRVGLDLLRYHAADVATVRIADPVPDCGLIPDRPIDGLLKAGTEAVVETIDQAGSTRRYHGTIRSGDETGFVLRLTGAFPGMSGAPVKVDGTIVGQVQTAKPGESSVGAIRADYLMALLDDYFVRTTPILLRTSITEVAIQAGSIDALLNPSRPLQMSLDVEEQHSPVTIDLRPGDRTTGLSYRRPPHGPTNAFARQMTVAARMSPTDDWQIIGTPVVIPDTPLYQTEPVRISGLYAEIRVILGFGTSADSHQIGSIFID